MRLLRRMRVCIEGFAWLVMSVLRICVGEGGGEVERKGGRRSRCG